MLQDKENEKQNLLLTIVVMNEMGRYIESRTRRASMEETIAKHTSPR
jgi:hypothetical protein